MRRIIFKYYYLIQLSLVFIINQPFVSNAQEVSDVYEVNERVILVTDRTIYTAGEAILFNASYLVNRHIGWSKILYIEIIDHKGTPFYQQKFAIYESKASGELLIPSDIISGVYYVKAYTKWMQNYSIDSYCYKRINIINPASKGNIEIKNDSTVFDSDHFETNSNIRIELNKEAYNTRSNIVLSVYNKKSVHDLDHSVSVVRKGANNIFRSEGNLFNNRAITDSITYLPEIFTSLISGVIVNKENNKTEPGMHVLLSSLSADAFLLARETNANGEFVFTIPDSFNTEEFFITVDSDKENIDIIFNESWCKRPIQLEEKKLVFNTIELNLANEISINYQLEEKYELPQIAENIEEDSIRRYFYGSPDKIYTTHKYIDLPNIKEFIYEIVPEFSLNYKKGEPVLFMKNKNTFRNYPCLTLVDNIPVSLETLLSINIKKVKQIEIIDGGYVIGDFKYKAVINAITHKADFAGIDLPDNSMFFNYKFAERSNFEEYNPSMQNENNRIPDLRNTLYWNPDVQFVDGKADLSFYTSDVKGEYQIIIQSVSKTTGEVSYTVKDFTVQ